MSRIDTDTYLYSSTGGERIEETVYPGKTYFTPNYSYPESTAYYHQYAGWIETVTGEVYNKYIIFAFPAFTLPEDWPPLF